MAEYKTAPHSFVKDGVFYFNRRIPKDIQHQYTSRKISYSLRTRSDLPLNFHPAGTGALWVDTPIGAGGATDRCAEPLGCAARLAVVVNRSSANALGVW